MKKSNRTFLLVIAVFMIVSTALYADANSDAFTQVFREAGNGRNSNIIERMVNALYYGLLIIYRGVSVKISTVCGFILLAFMIIEILQTILREISRVDLYSVFRMIIPKFTKNLIIASLLVMPAHYPVKLGMGNGAPAGTVKGTPVTMITEIVFTMFFRLGTIFFNNPAMRNASPGELAAKFFIRPLNILKDVFGFMTFFAIFTNIAKIILLILCLWLAGKIIAVYVANIFMALMLTTFSVFYLLFLTMESTAQIGQKGIQIIVVQSVTLFMTVAMMGISYQVINLAAAGKSVQAIASLAIILLMLSQVMENVGLMAQSITSGGGLGNSSAAAFTGLAQAAQAAMAGLALFGGAKYDEMFGKESGSENTKNPSEKVGDDIKSITDRAMHNVGSPDPSQNSQQETSRNTSNVLSYRKGKGLKKSMKPAEQNMKRYRKAKPGIGTASARLFAALTGGMVSTNFEKVDHWKKLGKDISDSIFGSEAEQDMFRKKLEEAYGSNPTQEQIAEFAKNYPYSNEYLKQQKEVAVDTLKRAWNTVLDQMGQVNLNAAAGSDEYRRTRMNEAESNRKPREREIGGTEKKN